MVRLLVEEACDALPLPNRTQRRRNDRFLISTSNARALPRSGFVLRPHAAERQSAPIRLLRSGFAVPL